MQADQVQESVRPVGRTQVEPAHVDAWLDSMRGQPADRQVRLLQLHYGQVPAAREFAGGRSHEFGPELLDRMLLGDLEPAVRHAFEALHVRRAGPVQPWV